MQGRNILVLALVVVTAAACAPRTAPPPALPTAVRHPEFVFPALPQSLERAPGADRINIGWRYLQNDEFSSASREFTAALTRNPALYPAQAGEAYVSLARGNHEQAIAGFDAALRGAADYVPALVGRGQALLGLNRDADALASFEAALARDAGLTDVRRRVEVLRFRSTQQVIAAARSAAAAGRFDDARVAYEQAIRMSPESPFLYRELADVDRRQGNTAAALDYFRRAIDLDPSDVGSLVAVGDLLAGRQDFAGAEAAYRAAAAIEPSAELTGKIASVAESARDARLPAQFRAIAAAPQITRGDLAALIAVRLEALVSQTAPRQVVITDTRGHWAADWITQVAQAGLVDPFENHTFQPRQQVRRGDLAAAVSRAVTLIARDDPALRARVAARPKIADMTVGHLSYPAAAVAVASGVMPLLPGDRFQVNRVVSGAEAAETIARLRALAGGR